MDRSTAKGRKFLSHLGSYVIVIGALGLINLLTDGPNNLWFLFPAIAWGIGLAFHAFSLVNLDVIAPRWRKFVRHLISYMIVIGALGLINLRTDGLNNLWFLFPASAWGIGLAFHLLGALTGQDKPDEEEEQVEAEAEEPEVEARPSERAAPQENWPVMATPGAKTSNLANRSIQASVDKARAYQAQINAALRAPTDAAARSRLQDLSAQVAQWVSAIERLARRVDSYQQDSIIRQDLEAVPQAIAALEERRAAETDPSLREQLDRTLANRRNQLAALERLQTTMRRAEIQIESTLSSLGTIYSQLLTGQSTDHVADYSRLSAEVDEEVRTLQDQLEALEEVKLGRG